MGSIPPRGYSFVQRKGRTSNADAGPACGIRLAIESLPVGIKGKGTEDLAFCQQKNEQWYRMYLGTCLCQDIPPCCRVGSLCCLQLIWDNVLVRKCAVGSRIGIFAAAAVSRVCLSIGVLVHAKAKLVGVQYVVYIITRMYVDSVSAGDNSIYSGCFGTTAAADVEVFYGGP